MNIDKTFAKKVLLLLLKSGLKFQVSVNAIRDAPLSTSCPLGNCLSDQNLSRSRTGLCGWASPVSPLEVPSTVILVLHINGTYRRHWADRLGFCERGCALLAFDCIKNGGGVVPSTIGIQTIYTVLYWEWFISLHSTLVEIPFE
nr:PREDICTED: protein BREAST CANCER SUSCEPTIBILITY 2 homolog B [Daucus carota subsp. sativus]